MGHSWVFEPCRISPYHVGFLQVLRFPPTVQTDAVRLIGVSALPLVYECVASHPDCTQTCPVLFMVGFG